MARKTLSVSVSLPIWMDEMIDEEAKKHGVSYSAYLQEIIRDHERTPFDKIEEPVVCVDENGENCREEGAA